MAPQYHNDAGHNAPEVAPQQGYLYAVTDDNPSQHPASTKEPYFHGPPPPFDAHPASQPRPTHQGWKRWWILALIGLLVALIAGLIGGFVGQAIQKGRESSNCTALSREASECPSNDNTDAGTPTTSPSTGASPTTTPSTGASPTAIGTILIPETGCDFPTSRDRRRIDNQTLYTQKSYTTICNSGWSEKGSQDDLFGLWTLTPSDCIEACIAHNNNKYNERSCKGGGFIPSWTDRGMKTRNGPPMNCFLKNSTRGIGANERESDGIESVVLCMDGQCAGIGTS